MRRVDVDRGASFLGGGAAFIAVLLLAGTCRSRHSGDMIGSLFGVLFVLVALVVGACAVAVFLVWRAAIGRFEAGATEVVLRDLFDPTGKPLWASRWCWRIGIANTFLGVQTASCSLLPNVPTSTLVAGILLSTVGTLYCLAARGMKKRKPWAGPLAIAVAVVFTVACCVAGVWALMAQREEWGTWSAVTLAGLCAAPHVVVGMIVFRNRNLLLPA